VIPVIATIEVAERRRDDFLAECHRVVPPVRAESGCLDYGPTVDIASQGPPRNNIVTIVEKWESLDALKLHLQAPHRTGSRHEAGAGVAVGS